MIDKIELYYEAYSGNTTSNFNHCTFIFDAKLNYITLFRYELAFGKNNNLEKHATK